MNKSKNELRRYYKAIRLNMADKKCKDKKITENLLNSDIYIKAENILLYVSSSIEVDTFAIIENAFMNNKTVSVPRCNTEDCTMEFYIITSFEDLIKGAYGIYEPDISCKKAFFDEKSVCIVPGLSYDKDGYRLGFGKGFYDRFLSVFSGKSVGLCYDECVCEKTVRDKFDKSVSVLITETEIKTINYT